jgi:GTP1/Obg family GTP-binding protein
MDVSEQCGHSLEQQVWYLIYVMDVSEQCEHSLEQPVWYLICNGCIRTMWTFSGATGMISYM